MTAIAPAYTATGFNGTHRMHGAQVGDTLVLCNGHDKNQILSLRAAAFYPLGLAQPGAAPTKTASAAGVVNGAVRYRVRWRDKLTSAMSLASAELSVTLALEQPTITRPGSPPARATHWVLERTEDGGTTFYPVNRVITETGTEGPDGTPIATTTYTDNYSDLTIGARQIINNDQGVPKPYRYCFANENRIFMCDDCPHSTPVTVTNGSAAIVGFDSSFNSDMVGKDVTIAEDTDGQSYRVATFTDSTHLTLDRNYTGANGLKTAIICGDRSRIAWSQATAPEHYGQPIVGFLTNEDILGMAGEPTIGGIGLGRQGVLWAKEMNLYYHNYAANPHTVQGDGQIRQTAVRRGIAGPLALFFYNGFVWGMDKIGIWRMQPGGEPEEIGGPLGYEFYRNQLDQCNGDNWWIGVDPLRRWLYFFVCELGDTYPKKAYLWDLDRSQWIGSRPYPLGATAGMLIQDKNDAYRLGVFTDAASVTAGSRLWCDNIGKTYGVRPGNTPLTGTVTAGGAATLTCAGAAWLTSDPDLGGVQVTKIAIADGSEETRTIESNTATQLTVTPLWTVNPVAGDSFRIGEILSRYLTGWMDCGAPNRKKQFHQAHIKVKTKSACSYFYCKVYVDNSKTPIAWNAGINEDGVYVAAGGTAIRIDATAGKNRYEIPLGNTDANHLRLEIYSVDPGEPWELNGDVVIEFEIDEARDPRRG